VNPEVSIAVAVISIVDHLGGWTVSGVLAFICVTPALFVYLSARLMTGCITGLRLDLAAFKTDYENNIRFVEAYQKLVDRLEDTMRRSTIVMTKLVDRIDTIKEVN
jgi:hypothetical protein